MLKVKKAIILLLRQLEINTSHIAQGFVCLCGCCNRRIAGYATVTATAKTGKVCGLFVSSCLTKQPRHYCVFLAEIYISNRFPIKDFGRVQYAVVATLIIYFIALAEAHG